MERAGGARVITDLLTGLAHAIGVVILTLLGLWWLA